MCHDCFLAQFGPQPADVRFDRIALYFIAEDVNRFFEFRLGDDFVALAQ
jgi:hypothetical protein